MSELTQVVLGGTQLILNETETKDVNQPKDTFYLMANVPICLVTLVVNIWAVVIIRKKEKTGIHKLIICDCIVNVMSMADGTFR